MSIGQSRERKVCVCSSWELEKVRGRQGCGEGETKRKGMYVLRARARTFLSVGNGGRMCFSSFFFVGVNGRKGGRRKE